MAGARFRQLPQYAPAAMLLVLLFCYMLGGIVATVGVPISAVAAMALLLYWGRRCRLRSVPEPLEPEPLLRRLARHQVDSSITEVDVLQLGSSFRKDTWHQTEATVDGLIDLSIKSIRSRLDAYTVAIFFPADDEGYRLRRYWTCSEHIVTDATIVPGRGVLGGLFKNGLQPLNLGEIMSDSATLYYYSADTGIRSLIASPIIVDDALEGSSSPTARINRPLPRHIFHF